MSKIVLDLHPLCRDGRAIDEALSRALNEAVARKIDQVEIIPGKGSGQLKKRVLRFLDRKDIRQTYHRLKKDSKNWGRLWVYFRHG
ncbi:MAG: Smr/MutS family protein [Candidatus Omnitrophota bacterium]